MANHDVSCRCDGKRRREKTISNFHDVSVLSVSFRKKPGRSSCPTALCAASFQTPAWTQGSRYVCPAPYPGRCSATSQSRSDNARRKKKPHLLVLVLVLVMRCVTVAVARVFASVGPLHVSIHRRADLRHHVSTCGCRAGSLIRSDSLSSCNKISCLWPLLTLPLCYVCRS